MHPSFEKVYLVLQDIYGVFQNAFLYFILYGLKRYRLRINIAFGSIDESKRFDKNKDFIIGHEDEVFIKIRNYFISFSHFHLMIVSEKIKTYS